LTTEECLPEPNRNPELFAGGAFEATPALGYRFGAEKLWSGSGPAGVWGAKTDGHVGPTPRVSSGPGVVLLNLGTKTYSDPPRAWNIPRAMARPSPAPWESRDGPPWAVTEVVAMRPVALPAVDQRRRWHGGEVKLDGTPGPQGKGRPSPRRSYVNFHLGRRPPSCSRGSTSGWTTRAAQVPETRIASRPRGRRTPAREESCFAGRHIPTASPPQGYESREGAPNRMGRTRCESSDRRASGLRPARTPLRRRAPFRNRARAATGCTRKS